jgi:hypothetical protein
MSELRGADGFGGYGDEFYERLVGAHQGLSERQSGVLNARLILLLANQVGDRTILAQVLAAARASVSPAPEAARE